MFFNGIRIISWDNLNKAERTITWAWSSSSSSSFSSSFTYVGSHIFRVWLIEGGRYLETPNVTFQEHTGDMDESPDPRDIVRSLPEHVQKQLRHRTGRKAKTGIKNKDHNVVDDDVTDEEQGVIKRKRGRPRKQLPELSRTMTLYQISYVICQKLSTSITTLQSNQSIISSLNACLVIQLISSW